MKHKPFDNGDEARRYLNFVGTQEDKDIDLFETSLALASLNHPEISIDKYRNHFKALCDDLYDRYEDLSIKQNGDTLEVQSMALRDVMARHYGYIGDDKNYDDLQNVDIIRVIDRRTGMPITLSLLAIALCRTLEWQADGLNFPGHFLMRLQKDGERSIIDPFQGCVTLQAIDLRTILKRVAGANAELSNSYYDPCTNRDILMRLQNNIKLRLIDSEHYKEAFDQVEIMRLIAPKDYRIYLDAAVLLARLERPMAAIENLSFYLEMVRDPQLRSEAEIFMNELKSLLN